MFSKRIIKAEKQEGDYLILIKTQRSVGDFGERKKIIRLWVSVYVSTHMFAADPSIRLIALGLSEISVSIMLTTGKADS